MHYLVEHLCVAKNHFSFQTGVTFNLMNISVKNGFEKTASKEKKQRFKIIQLYKKC